MSAVDREREQIMATAAELSGLDREKIMATAEELFSKMAVLYTAIMPDHHYDFSRGKWIVRLWDGMDGCWSDVTKETDAFMALGVWFLKTGGGQHNWQFSDIDYYRIFPAETRMVWDGEAGRELFRPPQTDDERRVVVEGFKGILAEGGARDDDSK